MAPDPYPLWTYYPPRDQPPQWVHDFVEVVAGAQETIDSRTHVGVKSDDALAELRTGLQLLGYRVESGKSKKDKIQLPVLFGEQGIPPFRYEVDAIHDELGVLVEVEAGRGWTNGAFYRDLIRGSLIVGARFLVVGLMQDYRGHGDYHAARDQLDAIYASNRLALPLEGVLLFGY